MELKDILENQKWDDEFYEAMMEAVKTNLQ
jgi:hypothetical protein